MSKPVLPDHEFVRICHISKSIAEIAKTTGYNERTVRRKIKDLEPRWGPLKPVGFYAQQQILNTGHIETLEIPAEEISIHFSDAHFWPSVDSPMFEILLKITEHIQPYLIHDNGDSFDGFSISRHPPHGWSDGPNVREELDENLFRHSQLVKASPQSKKYWVWGNHDARYDSVLANKVPEFKELGYFSLKDHFPDWKFCQGLDINGSLRATHKWKGGIHAAYNETIQAGLSYMTGHDHTCWCRPFTDLKGTRYGIKTGTLCPPGSPQFFYTNGTPTNWQEGFIIIHWHGKTFTPTPVLLQDGKAFWSGKWWKP